MSSGTAIDFLPHAAGAIVIMYPPVAGAALWPVVFAFAVVAAVTFVLFAHGYILSNPPRKVNSTKVLRFCLTGGTEIWYF